MRVTHLGKFYPPVPGGMERVLQALCEGERLAGIDSRALVAGTGGRTRDDVVGGVPVTRARSLLRVGSVWFSPALVRRLWRVDCDLLVLHEPNPMALLAYALVRPRQPLVVWYHSEVIRPRWRYRAFYHPFLSFALRRASRIVVSSPALASHARALAPYRDRTVVIPFGIPVPAAAASAEAAAVDDVRQRWQGPIVLFVGRLVPYKGVDVLLEALRDVHAAAVIVGDGPLRGQLQRRATELGVDARVFFVGRAPEAALAAWYSACDLLVLPSVTAAEAFGLVQLEAMARGKPIVSTQLESGVPWVNQDGITGLTVPPGDAQALRRAIASLTTNHAGRSRMGRAARDRFLSTFTRERMVEQTAALYADVVANARRRTPAGKRVFDVALSGIGLCLSAPVWLVAAALIKLEDGGPVFYRQARVGLRGTPFTVLKFRSMVTDAEREHGPLQAAAGDPRVTRVGRLLRATAMDELPQLVNIFRGDMSFVGPRALRPGEIDAVGDGRLIALEDIAGYEARIAVQPGLTGVAQIYAPRDVARRHKFRYDLVYVRRRSFWLDLRLIILSFWISLRGAWEHRGRKF